MVLGQRGAECFVEHGLGHRALIGERHLELILEHAERHGIRTRSGEPEIDQLKHRLEIFAGRSTAETFLRRSDVGSDRGRGAGEDLLEIDVAERSKPALFDDLGGGCRWNEVRVARERRAAGADRAEHDFILLERRRLQHDADAVG